MGCVPLLPRGRFGHAADDPVGVRPGGTAQLLDGSGDARDRVFAQQLQHAHEMTHALARSVPLFQSRSQFVEARGQFPIAKDVRVVERGRSSGERHQIMPGIEYLIARFVTPPMHGHDLVAEDDFHSVDVGFDRHGLESRRAGHAVGDALKAGELVLVDLRRFADAGIERMLGQRRSGPHVFRQAVPDRSFRVATGA